MNVFIFGGSDDIQRKYGNKQPSNTLYQVMDVSFNDKNYVFGSVWISFEIGFWNGLSKYLGMKDGF